MNLKKLVGLTGHIRTNIQHDINIQQLDILFRVALNPGITQPELMEQTGLMTGSISRHLAKLGRYRNHSTGKMVGLGYVIQSPDPENRKRLASYLTLEGKQAIEEVLGSWDNTSK